MNHDAASPLTGYKNTENKPVGTTIKPIMGIIRKFAKIPIKDT
jgi:hypothetical protein